MIVAANALVTSRAIWYAMRASGIVSLLLLTAVALLGIGTVRRWRPPRQPRFVTAGLHRSISLLAVVFVALHVMTAVADPYAAVNVTNVLVPFTGGWRPFWLGLGTLSLDLVAALVVTSLLRRRLAPRVWRGIHWLGYLAWPVAVAHGLGTGSDAGTLWLRGLTAVCVGAVVTAAVVRLAGATGAKHLDPQRAAA